MSRKRFSKEYRTYGEWLKAQPRTTEYARRIIRFHERFPNLSLNELRNTRLKDHDLSTASWNILNSQQKRDRKLSLQILRLMRKDVPFSKAVEKTGIHKKDVVRNLGKYLYKSKGKWKVTATDRIEVEMLIYDRDAGQISIVTTNSIDRSLIGSYFNAVNRALKTGDSSLLKRFDDIQIIDANGEEHSFVTDLDELYEIQDSQEEPEFLEIYGN
ncbi:hypothetical protein LI82_07655 [Methanococcoides methylutens]|uniref:Uncharacterized protein n=1 Tax=Methanococcoides methylutens TaxID=2226 RepID=A0A099T0P0_METMT|nr:hypothetical protein [Methanococcoides methylutens]KGK98712.1 hypothetical protein LI82_07655 [Methanococcoides methylutens]